MKYSAFATPGPGQSFDLVDMEMEPLAGDDVLVKVETCGLCHSDLSMKNNDWGMTAYPFVGGHEVIGHVVETGPEVRHLKEGQKVGVGWYSRSCGVCRTCLSGKQNLCPEAEGTIVNRHGGFAQYVRAQGLWCTPIPENLELSTAGPLFCGGITVFNPIVQNHIVATHHVAVVGIGGLGHMALQFLAGWGCEVTAFTTSESKFDEARSMGADHVVNSKDRQALESLAESFDMILIAVNVELEWELYINMLKREGTLHFVGAAPSVSSAVFPLIEYQKKITGSPLGSPALVETMLDFCARKKIGPVTQNYSMSKINDAFEHLEAGKARYRLVLEADW